VADKERGGGENLLAWEEKEAPGGVLKASKQKLYLRASGRGVAPESLL